MIRPEYISGVPLVNPVAASMEDFCENFRRIYAGGLADNRSIGCGQGVYFVRVIPPLFVSDDGVGVDLNDPMFRLMMIAALSDKTPTDVDPGVAAAAGTGYTASRSDHRHGHGFPDQAGQVPILAGDTSWTAGEAVGGTTQGVGQTGLRTLGYDAGTGNLTEYYRLHYHDKYGHLRSKTASMSRLVGTIVGKSGAKGDKGDTGTGGSTGPIGVPGPPGGAGASGPTGATGSAGPAGSFYQANGDYHYVSTGSTAGSSATVTLDNSVDWRTRLVIAWAKIGNSVGDVTKTGSHLPSYLSGAAMLGDSASGGIVQSTPGVLCRIYVGYSAGHTGDLMMHLNNSLGPPAGAAAYFTYKVMDVHEVGPNEAAYQNIGS